MLVVHDGPVAYVRDDYVLIITRDSLTEALASTADCCSSDLYAEYAEADEAYREVLMAMSDDELLAEANHEDNLFALNRFFEGDPDWRCDCNEVAWSTRRLLHFAFRLKNGTIEAWEQWCNVHADGSTVLVGLPSRADALADDFRRLPVATDTQRRAIGAREGTLLGVLDITD